MGKYEEHIIAFVDFLGFREALHSGNHTEKILHLLTSLAAFKGDFHVESTKTEGGRTSNLRPAITAFSDNIVISYPTKMMAEHDLDAWTAAIFLQRLVGFIAWNAFDARLLIRGGVAIGDLYHSDGVIFGPALVDAYDTEKTMAVFPRVVFAASFSQANDFDKWKHNYPEHEDGLRVLPYMTDFVTRAAPGGGKFNTMVKPWVANVRAVVATEIATLSGRNNSRALANWYWFKSNLERALETLPLALLEMETP